MKLAKLKSARENLKPKQLKLVMHKRAKHREKGHGEIIVAKAQEDEEEDWSEARLRYNTEQQTSNLNAKIGNNWMLIR